jgi:hypothetical protein
MVASCVNHNCEGLQKGNAIQAGAPILALLS